MYFCTVHDYSEKADLAGLLESKRNIGDDCPHFLEIIKQH